MSLKLFKISKIKGLTKPRMTPLYQANVPMSTVKWRCNNTVWVKEHLTGELSAPCLVYFSPAVCTENLSSGVVVVKSAKDGV